MSWEKMQEGESGPGSERNMNYLGTFCHHVLEFYLKYYKSNLWFYVLLPTAYYKSEGFEEQSAETWDVYEHNPPGIFPIYKGKDIK